MAQRVTIDEVEKPQIKTNIPAFRSGDTVRVHTIVKEGTRERIQIFEGVVLQKKNAGLRANFTVRKVSFGIGVERIFPISSPMVEKIEVVRTGKVKKARIFHMRGLSAKKSRLKERDAFLAKAAPEAVVAAVSTAGESAVVVEG
jgi:large subunit ribosomal protein L19